MLTLFMLIAVLISGRSLAIWMKKHCDWLDPFEAYGLGYLMGLTIMGGLGLLLSHLKLFQFAQHTHIFLLGFGAVSLGLQWKHAKISTQDISNLVKNARSFQPLNLLYFLPFIILSFFIFQKVTGPFDMFDWDTMAYHFAVLQIWQRAGGMEYIPTIHHSNFPFLVEFCAFPGIAVNDFVAAKSVTLWFYLAGCLWVYGIAKRILGEKAALVSFLVFSTCPLAVMNSGSGYIDLAHGIFSAIALIYAIEWAMNGEKDGRIWLVSFGLFASLSSKYTGLQIAAVAVLSIIYLVIKGKKSKSLTQLAFPALLCMMLSAPTFVRNYSYTGNPVYPFFYEVFHGRNWDQWRADIYRDEQQTFGVGRQGTTRDKSAIGHAFHSLAYQPGRFINPGQDSNFGLPIGAMGAALILAFALSFWWLGSDKFFRAMMGSSLLILVFWFLLSQQSRYMLSLAPIFSLIFGALTQRVEKLTKFLQVTAAAQALYTIGLFHVNGQGILDQITRSGAKTSQAQQEALVPMSGMFSRWEKASEGVNPLDKQSKVALFDEVFGLFIPTQYYWANPGHSMLLPYESMQNGEDFSKGLLSVGTTHVYLNQFSVPRELSPEELQATGKTKEELLTIDQAIRRLVLARIQNPEAKLSEVTTRQDFTNPNQAEILATDLRIRWKIFILHAFNDGRLQLLPYSEEPDMTLRGPLFKVVR